MTGRHETWSILSENGTQDRVNVQTESSLHESWCVSVSSGGSLGSKGLLGRGELLRDDAGVGIRWDGMKLKIWRPSDLGSGNL